MVVNQTPAIPGLRLFFSTSGYRTFANWSKLHAIDLQNDVLTVDGNFAVARQEKLDFSVKKAAKGFLGAATSGEGIVNVIEGTGRVYIAPVPNAYVSLTHHILASMVIPSA